jgi:N-acetylneuraminic acid mutarotase
MPTPRDHLAAATVDGKLYAVGGRIEVDFDRNLNVNEEYDPATDTWTQKSTLPTPRSGIAAASVEDVVYVFGGEGSNGTFTENEAYVPASDEWSAASPMPTARHGIGAAVHNGEIFVMTGGPTPGFSVTPVSEAFTP